MTTVYPVVNAIPWGISQFALGQEVEPHEHPPAEPESLEISRSFADSVRVAILRLAEASQSDPSVTREQCWRDVTIRKREVVQHLLTRITLFLDTTEETLTVNGEEYALIEEAFGCVEEIVEWASVGTGETLETVATVVGIAGGLAALIALVV